jgi:2,3-bisphosphoglycerate-dependent phosphoglycerate mutase
MNNKTAFKKNWIIYPGAIIIIVIICFCWWCRTHPVTTVLLVRHAEKGVYPPDDPPLTPEGETRAQILVHVVESADIKGIFATQLLRTQQTVGPLAANLDLIVNIVNKDNTEELVNQIKSNYRGKVVIVAGHSDTVPVIVEELGGDPNSAIVGNVYDNLFVITVFRYRKPKVLNLKYGNPG